MVIDSRKTVTKRATAARSAKLPPRVRSSLGFSLIELIVTLGVSALFLSVLANLFSSQVGLLGTQGDLITMQESARIGAELIVREVRMAGYDPTESAGAGFLEASSGSIRFTLDGNGDGDTNDPGEDIKYTVLDVDGDGSLDLGRSTDSGGSYEEVIGEVQDLRFYYTLRDGTRTDSPPGTSEIRKIEVFLECLNPGYYSQTWTSTGSTRLRNAFIKQG